MNEVKMFRILMERLKRIPFEKEELWQFTRLSKEITGLDYNIFIDDNKTYETYNHDLWLYVECKKGLKVPITISQTPIVKKFIPKNEFNLEKIYNFIRCNETLIKNYANGLINFNAFSNVIESLKKDNLLTEGHSWKIDSTLRGDETGLSTDIWVDENQTYQGHAPRIKFRHNKQKRFTREFASMEINDTDRIHNINGCELTRKELQQIKEFVKLNRQALLDLANNIIDINHFRRIMKIVGKQEEIDEVGKFVNGFAVIKRGNKYNYIDVYGNLLLDKFVDSATNFNLYNDNMLIATIKKDGKDFYIDDSGKTINF